MIYASSRSSGLLYLAFLVPILVGLPAAAPAEITYTESGIPFLGVWQGDSDFGDYDNDGDLDVIVTGMSSVGPTAYLYRNDGPSQFTAIDIGLPGVFNSTVVWGDYDNDNDLDLVLTGARSDLTPVARIYRNDSATFTDIGAAMTPVYASDAAWGDYDNDGDLDLVVTGLGTAVTYRNDGDDTFTALDLGFQGMTQGAVVWGDYDEDGDLDLFLSGDWDAYPVLQSFLYNNQGDGAFTATAPLQGSRLSTAQWVDGDGDGDLDLVLAGESYGYGIINDTMCRYENQGNGQLVWGFFGTDIHAGEIALADYDNDGDQDIVLSGLHYGGPSGVYPMTRILVQGEWDNWDAIDGMLADLAWATVDCGDVDDDGDLDLFLTGTPAPDIIVSNLWRCSGVPAGTPPLPPTSLSSEVDGQRVTFSWGWGPGAVTYNLWVGTTPSGCEIMSPMADPSNGKRRVVAMGNVNQNHSWTLELPVGTYYWRVQSVDGAFAGSAFSPGQVVTLVTGVDEPQAPRVLAIRGNRPNPFNPTTVIDFDVPRTGRVTLQVFDMAGRLVATLVDEALAAGQHGAIWDGRATDGRAAASGVYVARLQARESVVHERMTLVR